MINTNVTCDILLGFVRGAFFKEVDDICKQRSVKISIEIEGVKKQREGLPTDGNEPSTPTSEHQELKGNVVNFQERIINPSKLDLQSRLEQQLETLQTISRTLKEIQASGQLDVIDDTGTRMKLNDHLRVRAMELLKPRQVYQLVKLSGEKSRSHSGTHAKPCVDVPEAPPTALKFTMSV
ncbi:unnamed protein product [Aphanomyces euteiches]